MNAEQAEALRPVAEALMKLGYDGDTTAVWDAALRMVWVPDLAEDMLAFAALAPGQRTLGQPMLQRPLAEGLTVSSLMSGYTFDAAGAFLMGSALITHPTESQAMLAEIRANGRTIISPDGSYAHITVPAGVAAPLVVPRGGEDVFLPATNEAAEWDAPAPPLPIVVPAAAPSAFCVRCGARLAPGDRFCRGCGSPVT